MYKKIIVFGPTYLDHTLRLRDPISLDGSARIEKEEQHIGGTGLCYAIALGRLGNQVSLHSVIGNDVHAEFIKQQVSYELNIRTDWQIYNGLTDYAFILLDRGNHKAVASRKEISNLLDVSTSIISDARAIVITSLRNDVIGQLLERTEREGEKPYVMWAPHLSNCYEVKQLADKLHLINHITLSKEEFDTLQEVIGNPIDFGVQSITVTGGKKGCDLINSKGSIHYDPIHVVKNPLDTNGAGEAFGSGFLTALLATNDYETSIKAGSYVAFLHIHRLGSDFPRLSKKKLLDMANTAKENAKIPLSTLLPNKYYA